MKRVFAGALLLASLVSAVSADPAAVTQHAEAGLTELLREAGFGNPRIKYWRDPARDHQNHELLVTLFALRGSEWTENEIEQTYLQARSVMHQCSIALDARFVEATAPDGGWLDATNQNQVYLARASIKLVTPPALYYVLKNDEHGKWAWAFSRDMCKGTIRCDTGFITHDILMPAYRREYGGANADFIVAHELGHVLLQTRHHVTGTPNLMNDEGTLMSPVLTDQQCTDMRNHPLVIRR